LRVKTKDGCSVEAGATFRRCGRCFKRWLKLRGRWLTWRSLVDSQNAKADAKAARTIAVLHLAPKETMPVALPDPEPASQTR
jgi:hypothetical protein